MHDISGELRIRIKPKYPDPELYGEGQGKAILTKHELYAQQA